MPSIDDQELMARLGSWCDKAAAVGDADPLAFALATVDHEARPTTRMISVKAIRPGGLVLFMNAATRKGRDVARRPDVAGTFWWPALGCQINLTGTLVDLGEEEADALWAVRDRVSRVADTIGPQGEPLVESLEVLRAAAAARVAGHDEIVRPASARAYLLRPVTLELWTQGENRIHERLMHVREEAGWRVLRLHP